MDTASLQIGFIEFVVAPLALAMARGTRTLRWLSVVYVFFGGPVWFFLEEENTQDSHLKREPSWAKGRSSNVLFLEILREVWGHTSF